MPRVLRSHLLAVGALILPSATSAQLPQPKAREIAAIPGVAVETAVLMPNGKIMLYGAGDSLSAYDPSTKRTTLVTRGWGNMLLVSAQGDRLVYDRPSEDGRTNTVWTIPIASATGAAAGPAQRVTMGSGRAPSLSPDGGSIAFGTFRGKGFDLAVVPSTGGAERVLASFARRIDETAWSADGKSIFVQLIGQGEDSLRTVERVPAAGGPSERVITYWSLMGGAAGQLNGQIAFYRTDRYAIAQGRMAYATASGRRGEFQIPRGAAPGWGLGPPALLTKTTRPTAALILDLADGKIRDLLPGALLSRAPVWSDDGRRIALQDSANGGWRITVMNADGSDQRHYPVNPDPNQIRWSPNGRMLAYYADSRKSLMILELATGATRKVTSAGSQQIAGLIWRPDSKSLVVNKEGVAANGNSEAPTEVYETGLDGTERLLRDVQRDYPGYLVQGFISDRLVSSGTFTQPATMLMSLDGAPARKLPLADRRFSPGVSNDGKQILFVLRSPGPDMSVELLTADAEPVRTLNLPFVVDDRNRAAPFHPDGAHVILLGNLPGERVTKIFLVPLNGDAPRVLATHPGMPYSSGRLDLSPDGKQLVFTSIGPPESTMYQLDFRPILQLAKP